MDRREHTGEIGNDNVYVIPVSYRCELPPPYQQPSVRREYSGEISNSNGYETPVSYTRPSDLPPPYGRTEPQQEEHTGEIPNGNANETPPPYPSDYPPPQQLTEPQQFQPSTVPPYLHPAGLQPLMTSYLPPGYPYIAAPLPEQRSQEQQQQVNTCIHLFQCT